VTVADDDGGSNTNNSTVVDVANVAPTANFSAAGPFIAGVPVTFSFTNQFDPSNADTSAGFTYFYDFNGSGFTGSGSSSSSQTFKFDAPGTYTVKGRIEDKDRGFTDYTTSVRIVGSIIAVGNNAGTEAQVKVFDAITGMPEWSFDPYPGNTGGVRVAVADVNGDGVPDVITAAGSSAPHVQVFDGVTHQAIYSFYAFNPNTFPGGVTIAAADLNGDGKADLIIGANQLPNGFLSLSHVEVLDGSKLDQKIPNTGIIAPSAVLADFVPYNFEGEIRVAAGDVNGDGVPDIITGPGPGGGPEVKVFDFKNNLNMLFDFNAFPEMPNYNGGVYVAAGDLNGDGHADIIVGQGAGTNALLRTFSGVDIGVMGTTVPFGALPSNGITVAAVDHDGDGLADVIVGSGQGISSSVLTLEGSSLNPTSQFPFDPSFMGGVYVG
jgi:hypothetical protein